MLSVSDGVFEAFHAIQLYKVASATRCDGPDNCWAYDLAGPWYVNETETEIEICAVCGD